MKMSDGGGGKQSCRGKHFKIQEEQSERDRLSTLDSGIFKGNPEECMHDRLINATIACIENGGIHAVTIRSIAEEAGLNSAAINYYFGTKDKLIEEALRQAMATAMVNFELFQEKDKDSFAMLQSLLKYNFEGMVSYPEIFKAYFYDPFVKNKYESDKAGWFNDFLCQLVGMVKKLLPAADELEAKITVMQLVSSMLVPGILPGLYRETLGIDIKDPEMQRKYIDYLLDRYIRRGET